MQKGCSNDLRDKRFGDNELNLTDKTVTAIEKTKIVPNPLECRCYTHNLFP